MARCFGVTSDTAQIAGRGGPLPDWYWCLLAMPQGVSVDSGWGAAADDRRRG